PRRHPSPGTRRARLDHPRREPVETSPGFEKAAGLEPREREIEETFSGSVFPPKISDAFTR
ncbi:MAG: hypothetical protein ACNA8W_24455, partial [Bradymonadaceae bacterium]